MMQKFTAEMARTMTPEQIVEFWKQRNRALRDAGKDHFDTLEDAITGEILDTI